MHDDRLNEAPSRKSCARLLVIVGAVASVIGGCRTVRALPLDRDETRQHLAGLCELSDCQNRDVWYPAVEQLGALARTSEEMRAAVWARARVNTLGMRFVEVPPGTFMMGATADRVFGSGAFVNSVAHPVEITGGYYISITEVTNAQFSQIFTDHQPYLRTSPLPDTPAVTITWDKATEFCELLSKLEGARYRLPTEAEWEYACRAGSTTSFCHGDDPAALDQYAWYGEFYKPAARVASFKPNRWGIFDMHGNAVEWVLDWYLPIRCGVRLWQPRVVRDPQGPASGYGHVLRGGYWACWNPEQLSSTYRVSMPVLDRPLLFQIVDPGFVGVREGTGFRIVRVGGAGSIRRKLNPEREASSCDDSTACR